MSKKKFFVGKISRNLDKTAPRNCSVFLCWELRDKGNGRWEFSGSGEVWNHLKTDIIAGGQCVDMIAKLFPHSRRVQRFREVWERWHLNDMNAGTVEQRGALEKGRGALLDELRAGEDPARFFHHDGEPNWYAIARHLGHASGSHYEVSCDILERAGMLSVPMTDAIRSAALGGIPEDWTYYKYGSRWLYEKIPADVLEIIRAEFRTGNDPAPVEDDDEDDADLIAEAGLSIRADFVPWSQSRNSGEKYRSLNWKITVLHHGAPVFVTDYMAGEAHAPSYNRKFSSKYTRRIALEYETEKGHKAGNVSESGHVYRTTKKPSAIEPDSRQVISCILRDCEAMNAGNLENWCAEFGMDPDSSKARAMYDECVSKALQLRGAIGPAMFERLMEANA